MMKTMKAFLAGIALLIVSEGAVYSAECATEQTILDYFMALKRLDFDRMAALRSLKALDKDRAEILQGLEAAEQRRELLKVLRVFHGVSSLFEARRLSSRELFIAISRGVHEYHPERIQQARKQDFKILGGVKERPNLRHFVCKRTNSDIEDDEPSTFIVTLRREGDGWLVVRFNGPANLFEEVHGDIVGAFLSD